MSIGQQEVLALIRALYVVKDNWWLDETEERLLQQLEAMEREAFAPARS